MSADQIAAEAEQQIEAIISMRWGEPHHGDIHEAVRQVIKAAIDSYAAQANEQDLYAALVKAKETIHDLHGDVAWEIYDQHSPEMKTINAALQSRAEHARDAREHRMKSAKPGQNESET